MVVSAHIWSAAEHGGLPDQLAPSVDLFAAETGSLIALTLYLLGDELNTVSTLLPARLRRKVEQRVIEPALTSDHYWWMGIENPGHMLNNWTPWIVSNWLVCILLDDQPARRTASLYKAVGCLDRFLACMPADGGATRYHLGQPPPHCSTLELLRRLGECVELLRQRLSGHWAATSSRRISPATGSSTSPMPARVWRLPRTPSTPTAYAPTTTTSCNWAPTSGSVRRPDRALCLPSGAISSAPCRRPSASRSRWRSRHRRPWCATPGYPIRRWSPRATAPVRPRVGLSPPGRHNAEPQPQRHRQFHHLPQRRAADR